MKLGIVGLPNSGKTTIFNALTGQRAAVGQYSRKTNLANVEVSDARLELVYQLNPREKRVNLRIDFIDAAEAAGRAESLAIIRQTDALLCVARGFEESSVPYKFDTIDPERDIREIETDLILADLDVVTKRLQKLEKERQRGLFDSERQREFELLSHFAGLLENEKRLYGLELAPADEKLISGYLFFTAKPILKVFNIDESGIGASQPEGFIAIAGKIEAELAALEPVDRAAFMKEYGISESATIKLIHAAWRALAIVTFYTIGKDEVRAWGIRRGATALEAAAKIHTDIAKGFIKAEVLSFEDLASSGSIKAAREAGNYRLEGADYIVTDGDIMQFRFN